MALTGTVQRFDQLPDSAPAGSVYKIAGGTETSFVPYYVKRTADGVWDETVAPGLANYLDPATMPHALVRLADGTFRFAPFNWGERKVGDEVTNPVPGFVGRTIRSVFVNQNRLAFLYDENTVLSGAGDFGQFFRLSVLDYLDSDPIDVAATSTKVSILQDAVPFNDGVMLFSDQTQFSMTNGEAGLSASSLAIRPVTNYETTRRASPVALGSEVYMASDSSGNATIREYTRNPDSDNTSAADVTAHVSRYIPGGVTRLIPAGDLNALFILTDGDPNAVYVYQFYWVDGQTKAQSAWHRWSLPETDTILSGVYNAGDLTLTVSRASGVYQERIRLTTGARKGPTDAFPYLDRRVTLTGVYNPTTNRTAFNLPDPVEHPERYQLVRGASYPGSPGNPIPQSDYMWVGDQQVSVPGNLAQGPVLGGLLYDFRYRFSQPYLRRQDGTAILGGRLQLRTLRISYTDTTAFTANVWPYGLDAGIKTTSSYSGLLVGTAQLNKRPSNAGDFPIQVYGHADQAVVEIENSGPFGCSFQSAEWEAFYWSRARP